MRFHEPEVRVLETREGLFREAAGLFAVQAAETLAAKESFTVALPGGSTPRGLFSLLAGEEPFRSRLPWGKIHFFWGDERPVPPDHRESNYRLAFETLLSRVAVSSEHIHRIPGENPDPAGAASQYEEVLRRFFGLGRGEIPRLDLVLLGMGEDGHTASLFPGTEALGESTRLVVANWIPRLETWRITLTLPVLNGAGWVLFLVSGERKAGALRAVLEGEGEGEILPAGRVRPRNGKVVWLVDRAAAKLLRRHPGGKT